MSSVRKLSDKVGSAVPGEKQQVRWNAKETPLVLVIDAVAPWKPFDTLQHQ